MQHPVDGGEGFGTSFAFDDLGATPIQLRLPVSLISLTNKKNLHRMKTIIAIAAIVLFCGCYSYKEMQVQMMNAELIRIDTVYRYERAEQVLTWKGTDNSH